MPTIEELESQIDILKRRLDEAETRAGEADTRAMQAQADAQRKTIDTEFTAAAFAEGARRDPEIIKDIIKRAVNDGWQMDSQGRLVRMVDKKIHTDTAGKPITPLDWMRSLKASPKTPAYLFSDADPQPAGMPGTPGGEKNPWTKDHWNLSDQGRVAQESLTKAEAMAKAAGSYFGATKPPGVTQNR